MGSSLKDLRDCPSSIRDTFGYTIYLAQIGENDRSAKRMSGDLRDVLEVRKDHDRATYRIAYTVSLVTAVYVLHVFKKKSKRGISTSRRDLNVMRTRYAAARHDDRKLQLIIDPGMQRK